MTGQTAPFNWSRTPSREGISKVYFADPDNFTSFNSNDSWITKKEFANAMDLYNEIVELKMRKVFFKRMFVYSLAAIPFGIIIVNVVTTLYNL